MSAILRESGFDPIDVGALADTRPGRDGVAVVAHAESAVDPAVTVFHEDYPAIPIVAVMANLDLGSFASLIRAGATIAADDEDDPAIYPEIVIAAISGRSSAPRDLMAAMAARIPATPDPSAWLTEAESGWLVALASGMTVADLAAREGYSEREMFRTLGESYARIGVKNRTEAIIWATRHGLLDG